MNTNKTILLGLNELNFDFINYYVNNGLLPNFKSIFKNNKIIRTRSEKEYNLLEPWIQWATVHTGKDFSQHKVFRLGDIVGRNDLTQIFEEIESKGFSVGAVSPFNAENRLKKASFFIPDPWTKTKPSKGFLIKSIYKSISQLVNDNSNSKLKMRSLFGLLIGLLVYVPITNWSFYMKNLLKFKKPGIKAVILDSLLADIFISLHKKNQPDFSNLFLNSGAHIQHHYLFNSEAYAGDLKNPDWYCTKGFDPLIIILKLYDKILGRLLQIKNLKLIIATGLHQAPHEKLTFYWRIKNHKIFIRDLGINKFKDLFPRMSRDFLITFTSIDEAKKAENIIESYVMGSDGIKIFRVDNRGLSLFIELVYPADISDNDFIFSEKFKTKINKFKSYISFVAIKNGEHNGLGYLTSNFNIDCSSVIKLKELNKIIKTAVYQ